MSRRPSWSYVQARLQARHGERLTELDWRALEAARSLNHFIDRSHATLLRRFSDRLNAGMSSHAVERALRSGWRDYVAEVASWCAPDWQAAILWCAPLPDLPTLDALLRGEVPRWVQQDAMLAAFIELERGATSNKSPLNALLPGPKHEPTLAGRWYAHWRALWPQGARERRALTVLAETMKAHVARLDLAGPQDTSVAYRRALAQGVTRMFRRHGGSPVAVFCHLVLVALDLERLRGGLARRALFAPAKEAA
jgi:hypothetical protein